MKIVHVTQYFMPELGYQETFLAKRQIELGHEVTVVTADRYYPYPNYESQFEPLLGQRIVGAGRRMEEGIDTWRLPCKEWRNHPWCNTLTDAINQLDPDVVHLHSLAHFMALPVVRMKNRGARFRLIADEHGTAQVNNRSLPFRLYRGFFRGFLSRSLSRAAHGVVGVTTDSSELANRVWGVPTEKIGMIPLGSDHRVFRHTEKGRKAVRRRLGLADDARVILFSGKIIANKKVMSLIEALPVVLARVPKAVLVLVGHPDTAYLAAMKSRAQELGVADRVLVCGAVKAVELPAWFSAADLACWPWEVTISMVDAASCGLPFLAPRNEGVEYQLSAGNGEFIDDMSLAPESFGNQIAALLSDPARLADMGARGRHLVETELSWDAVNDRFMELYEGGPVTGYRCCEESVSGEEAAGTEPVEQGA